MRSANATLIALLLRKRLPFVLDAHGRILQIPAGGTDDATLDSLAPSAPAPAAAPTAPAPSAAPAGTPAPSAAPAVAPSAAAPAPLDGPALLNALSQQLGIPADELKESLALTARMRQEHQRRQALDRESDPNVQQAAQRGRALRTLMAEGYSPEVANALESLPDVADYLHAQRAEGAQADMVSALAEIGVTFDNSKESLELRDEWEDLLTDRINANPKLVRLYNGTPAERREVIRGLVERQERQINAVLRKQNAATLRDHAARSASQPRAGRAVTATPRVRDEKPTATDPLQRRREGNAIQGRQLDDIFAHYN
jgi:hypothetical protein